MVNRLMRNQPVRPEPKGKCFVQSTSTVLEVLGGIELKPGDKGWVPLGAAQAAVDAGQCKIVRYDSEALNEICAGKTVADIPNLPGKFCPICTARGVVRSFSCQGALNMHHRSAHTDCTGQGMGRIGKRTRGPEADRLRDNTRESMRRFRARKRAAKAIISVKSPD